MTPTPHDRRRLINTGVELMTDSRRPSLPLKAATMLEMHKTVPLELL